MSEPIEMTPVDRPVVGAARPPGSKSLTNRALVCAALADGASTLTGALDSDDTRVMIDGLRALGFGVDVADGGRTLRVAGAGGEVPGLEADLFIGNSGTTVRFLTAVATLGHGAFRLDGVARMRERPIGDLVATLNALGASVRCESPGDCPPVAVHANGLAGGAATVRSDISSQFLSALLMAAPCARSETELTVDGELVSRPYVRMTLCVMRSFGVEVAAPDDLARFAIPAAGGYRATDYAIEPDASAASYFWAAAAITGGRVTVEGLSAESLQGDVRFVDRLEAMGCGVEWSGDAVTVSGPPAGGLRGGVHDMNAVSDTVQTLAAVALFADGPTEVTGVAHNRHKETDRIGDLATELRRLGATVEERPDGLVITPGDVRPCVVETYDDHRMAMSLALVGLRSPGVKIANPGCTSKTYPNYFDDLAALVDGGGTVAG